MPDQYFAELFPADTSPYYVAAPPYTRFSAGVKALHLLCHSLNARGQRAYLLPLASAGTFDPDSFCAPDLLTPMLTERIARHYFEKQQTPITIYPEIVAGAPFGGVSVVRYILNFPGLLGGDRLFDPAELCFSYSKVLAASTSAKENVLFIPTSDTRIFYPPRAEAPRTGSCFYASKYKRHHDGKLFEVTKHSLEITSDLPSSPTQEQIAELFRKSEIFYTYENTALATEATLCGCPVVFLPSEHLTSIIASEELGMDGYAWGTAPDEVARAKATVRNAFENYARKTREFYKSLNIFIAKTQEHAKAKKQTPSDLNLLLTQLPERSNKSSENNDYAPLLLKLPWKIEKKIGSTLCTLGLKRDGEFLWNRATQRSKKI